MEVAVGGLAGQAFAMVDCTELEQVVAAIIEPAFVALATSSFTIASEAVMVSFELTTIRARPEVVVQAKVDKLH